MSAVLALPPPRAQGGRAGATAIKVAYGVLSAMLLAYLIFLLVRGSGEDSPLVDDWMVAFFEVVASGLCIGRVIVGRRGWEVPVLLGASALAWAVGDLLLAAGGADAPTPSVADVFFLVFYPLAYAGMVLLLRREARERFLPATWLDGVIAGLGAAALCATFAFNAILHSLGGETLAVATNLAYPVGDVLLLGLAVGGTAVLARRRPPWALLAIACAINAAGDTFNLFNSAGMSSHVGTVVDGIAWPAAILLISISVWLPPGRSDPRAAHRTPGFLLPALGASASLAILLVATQHRVTQIGIGLATITLLVAGVRLGLSARSLRALSEEKQRQALTDELTGLSNRRELNQVLETFFADHAQRRTVDRPLAFLFLDLDHFKEINDSFGHSAGDELLKQVGPRLKSLMRSSDLLVRLGGDEFGILLLDADAGAASMVARRLLAALQEPFVLGTVSVRIRGSIGIALAPADARDGRALMRCADLAMYRAKSRDTGVEVYGEELREAANQLLLLEELRYAVERKQFQLHYQPLVDLRTGKLLAVEALLRWPHPTLGMVPPLRFLPLAEEAGLMSPLTRQVIEEALKQCQAWRQTAPDLVVSINVSASSLLEEDFTEMLTRQLAHHKLPPTALVLEITETTVIREFDRCARIIAGLRELGAAISIDDFGAGFTSLAYLGNLAASEIKLDRVFTSGMSGSERGRELVRATIDLGHSLGLRVVAEGIEDRATLTLLAELGCDLGQGYFIGRPVPPANLDLRSGSDLAPSLAA